MTITRRSFGAGLLMLAASPVLSADAPVIEGEVVYRERMALPAGAVVELSLQDVSRADAPAIEISAGQIPVGQGSPIPFRMTLSQGPLDSRRTYSLRARVLVEGEVWFTSTDYIPLPKPGSKVTIPVQRIGPAEPTVVTPHGTWLLVSLSGEPLDSTVRSDVTLEEGKAYGNSGCNRFTGSFTLDGESLTFSALASTNMICAKPAMEQEGRFHAALTETAAFALKDGGATLMLMDLNGNLIAQLRRQQS